MTAPRLASAFPSFLAECCFHDGARDAREGTPGARSCPHHGPEAIAWYRDGFAAASAQRPETAQ